MKFRLFLIGISLILAALSMSAETALLIFVFGVSAGFLLRTALTWENGEKPPENDN